MEQDVSSNETVNELAKKVLELYDVIDKQNDDIKKYQKALELAVYDKVFVSDCCNSCPFESDCDKENTTAIDCRRKFMGRWKGKAGLFDETY